MDEKDGLKVDPMDAPAARAPKKQAKKAAKNGFSEGDSVLIARKHLHGLHAIVAIAKGDAVVARVNEGQFEGFLVSFPSSDFERASKADLADHPNDRLDWDRYKD